MSEYLRARLQRDFRPFESNEAGADISPILWNWLNDSDWVRAAKRIPPTERRRLFADFGSETFDDNLGGYAQRLRINSRGVEHVWPAERLEMILRTHTEALFAELSDRISFCDSAETDSLLAQVRFDGFEHIETARDRGRGIIFLSVHQSHPSFGFKHPLTAGLKIVGVSHDTSMGDAGTALLLQGIVDCVNVLPATPQAVREILRTLAAEQCLAVYNDFLFPESLGIASPLFGQWVLISRSAVAIALTTQAAVLPVSVARQWPLDQGEAHVTVHAPLPLDDLDRSDPGGLATAAFRIGVATECLIRRDPAQWRLWDTLSYRWSSAEQASPSLTA